MPELRRNAQSPRLQLVARDLVLAWIPQAVEALALSVRKTPYFDGDPNGNRTQFEDFRLFS